MIHLLRKRSSIAFRKKIYTSIEQLQADLDRPMNNDPIAVVTATAKRP